MNPVSADESPNSERVSRAVVVGGGFGGLALAIRLQAAGVQTTIVEKRPRLGGRAYQLRDEGYVFDTGPGLIAGPRILQSLFLAAGSDMSDYVSLIRLAPYYRIYFHDGTHIDYVGDLDQMKAQMRAFNAGDADRLDAFMEAVHPIFDAVIADRLGSQSFEHVRQVATSLPRLIRIGALRHLTEVVERYFDDPRHRLMFSFHPLFIGGNPIRTPALYLVIPMLEKAGDIWFPRGGVYSLVQSLGLLFEELGGEVRTGTEVSRILVKDRRAVGVEIPEGTLMADLVVSNADVGHTYGELVDRDSRHHWSDRRLKHLKYSMSCFMLYLGVRRKYPQLTHHTLILSEDIDQQLQDIFDRKVLSDDFSLWVHKPTATDPSMAPEGCESLQVIVPVPNNESKIDWSAEAPHFAAKILDLLQAWGLEALRDNVEVMHVFTPDDFENELNATWGSGFSVEPRLMQTGWFRPHSQSEDVRDLYLVGASTHPGAGVPAVLLSAEATYGRIARDRGLPAAPDHHLPGTA